MKVREAWTAVLRNDGSDCRVAPVAAIQPAAASRSALAEIIRAGTAAFELLNSGQRGENGAHMHGWFGRHEKFERGYAPDKAGLAHGRIQHLFEVCERSIGQCCATAAVRNASRDVTSPTNSSGKSSRLMALTILESLRVTPVSCCTLARNELRTSLPGTSDNR